MANFAYKKDADSSKPFVVSHVLYIDPSVILADNKAPGLHFIANS